MNDAARIERRLKLHDLRVLLAVVETGSMVRAAAQLGTSQPAVSRSVADMERTLGVRLIERGPRGVEPTPFGRAFITRATAVFDELKQGVREVEFLKDPSAGELSIGASIVIASGFVAELLARLSSHYPRIAFRLFAAEAEANFRALIERKIDLLVVRMLEPYTDERIAAEVLYEEPHVVVASAQSSWAKRRKLSLADLINEPWTLPLPDSAYGSIFAEAFRVAGLEYPKAAISTYTNPVRNALVAKGRFLSIVPESEVRFARAGAVLKALPIDLPTMRRPIRILRLKNRKPSPVAQLFIDQARDFARSLSQVQRRPP